MLLAFGLGEHAAAAADAAPPTGACGGVSPLAVRPDFQARAGEELRAAFLDAYWGDPEPAQVIRIIRVELRE